MPKIIIGGKRYALEKRNLICEGVERNKRLLIDMYSRTKRLYYPQGKEFILATTYDIPQANEYKKISRKEAFAFMDKYPEGIKESVYVRYFGESEDA